MAGVYKGEMSLKKRFLIYGCAAVVFYMISLMILTWMKVEEPMESMEYIESTPGVYEAEWYIKSIPVSKTVIVSVGLGGFTVTSQNYPSLFLLPIATTAVALLVFAIIFRSVEFYILYKRDRKNNERKEE